MDCISHHHFSVPFRFGHLDSVVARWRLAIACSTVSRDKRPTSAMLGTALSACLVPINFSIRCQTSAYRTLVKHVLKTLGDSRVLTAWAEFI